MKASDNEFPKLILTEGAAPPTPAAGTVKVYAKAGGQVYAMDDTGTEAPLGGGGGGLPDAPSDGKTYGRKDGDWAEVIGGGGAAQAALLLSSVDELGPEDAAELTELPSAGTLTADTLVYLVDAAGNSVKTTLGALKTFINTDPSVVPSSNPWRGALVKLSSAFAVASGVAATIAWQALAYGTAGVWSVGAPTRLVIPEGVTRVRLCASVRFAASGTGWRSVYIMKNGDVFDGRGRAFASAISGQEMGVQAMTWDVPVVPGDYFEVVVSHTAGGSLNVQPDTQTWFGMTVVEATP